MAELGRIWFEKKNYVPAVKYALFNSIKWLWRNKMFPTVITRSRTMRVNTSKQVGNFSNNNQLDTVNKSNMAEFGRIWFGKNYGPEVKYAPFNDIKWLKRNKIFLTEIPYFLCPTKYTMLRSYTIYILPLKEC